MQAQIALYKGPPASSDWTHLLSHYGVRLWTWSRYSHAELVLGDMCYSASVRDGGVRGKKIDLTSGRWEVFPVELTHAEYVSSLWWFGLHDGARYDWPGIVRWLLPLVRQHKDRWTCFEAVGAALGLAAPHKLTGADLAAWARGRSQQLATTTTTEGSA